MEESGVNVGTKPWGDSAEKNTTVPASRKQAAVTRESTSWKNMISFLFAENCVTLCLHSKSVCMKAGLLCVTVFISA